MESLLRGVSAAAVAAALAGCMVTGPAAVRVGRAKYNDAIHQTEKQQMLQNLVRLRYNDFPYFLEVSSVLSAPSFEATAQAGANFNSVDAYDIGGGLRYAETPVIVYAPLSGEGFTRRLLQPLDMDTLGLLASIGWSTGRVVRLCVQSINGISNAARGAGPTPVHAPEYEVFNRIITTLDRLAEAGLADIAAHAPDPEHPDETELRLWIDPEAKKLDYVQQLLQDLDLDPGVEDYTIINAVHGGGGEYVALNLRPVIGCMYFMAQGIEIPQRDVSRGEAALTLDENGAPFDWHLALGNLGMIRSSRFAPALDAVVSVHYRGNYFYIASDDLDAQETFSLLYLLFTLQAGEKPSETPLLSLPVGG